MVAKGLLHLRKLKTMANILVAFLFAGDVPWALHILTHLVPPTTHEEGH